MRKRIAQLGVALAVLLSTTLVKSRAQTVTAEPFRRAVDAVINPWIAKDNLPGVAVGISLRGNETFYFYGHRDDAGNAFRADTIVEIGSCTKVFTATLLAEQVNDGHMALNNLAEKYFPAGDHLEPSTRGITLLMLATHTAGFPRDPTDLPNRLEKRSIENYTTADFFRFIDNWQVQGRLPAAYSYSNTGFGLLGYLVAKAAGADWENLVSENIAQPLGMSDTVIRLRDDQRSRIAQGHREDGATAPQWPVFAWYAAGALRSTPQDMLKFGEANLGHSTVNGTTVPQQLVAATQLAQQPRLPIDNGKLKQALGWTIRPPSPGYARLIQKDGGTAGFSSAIVICPPKDLAVFVVTNRGKAEAAHVGAEIAERIRPGTN
jgi:CubicO group peptidase (beta-lactamase class C family)